MEPNETLGRLRVYHWDDLGYTVRFSLSLDGRIEFDSYKIADNKVDKEKDPEIFIDRNERLYRKKDILKDEFVNLTDIQKAGVFISGHVNKDGSGKIEFTNDNHLDSYFKNEQDINNIGYLLNRIHKVAQGLM